MHRVARAISGNRRNAAGEPLRHLSAPSLLEEASLSRKAGHGRRCPSPRRENSKRHVKRGERRPNEGRADGGLARLVFGRSLEPSACGSAALPPEPGIWLTACGATFCTSCAIGSLKLRRRRRLSLELIVVDWNPRGSGPRRRDVLLQPLVRRQHPVNVRSALAPLEMIEAQSVGVVVCERSNRPRSKCRAASCQATIRAVLSCCCG